MTKDNDFSRTDTPRPGLVKEVTSLSNPIVKELRSLAIKKYRDQQGVFLAEGLKLVIDAIDQGWHIRTLVFSKAGKGNPLVEKVAARTKAGGGLVLEASEKVIAAITRKDNPQMVAAVFDQRFTTLDHLQPQNNDTYIALDRVRDPGNLGTIIRTADAAGAKGIILIGDCTDPYSLETVRATMGSIFAVPLYRTRHEEFVRWRKSYKAMLVGTHLKGAVDYRTIPYNKQPVMLLMGNEQQGLPDELAGICTHLARIPQAGRADSLNLAIATGIMLYEIRRDALVLDKR
ncbi:TrmH family RNA methyltransferase [Pseudochrobactrum sp. HB0163]|uniref:TrmH family RNA methyltransferase n=1 Tax=Pseudochrobactrum sp. HB0163 TaxID=3450708 RepID=UPI003F6DCC48